MSLCHQENAVIGMAAAYNKSHASRLAYIDNFRIFLTFMVILHHAAIAYGGSGGWGVKDPNTDAVSRFMLPIFNGLNQSYFMSAFFLLSGYFTPSALGRKGALRFLTDRLIRLGIPLLLYTTVVYPLNISIIEHLSGNTMPYPKEFGFHAGHLWFLEALLIFALIYVLIDFVGKRIAPTNSAPSTVTSFPSNRVLALTVFVLTIGTFAVRLFYPIGETFIELQLGHFTHYTFCYFVGAVAHRKGWFDALQKGQVKSVRKVAFITMPGVLLIGLFGGALSNAEAFENALHGGPTMQSLTYSLWESILMITLIITFLSGLKSRFNGVTPLGRMLADNAYSVYLLHQTVLLAINAALLSSPMPSILKLLVSVALTVFNSLLVSRILRRVPGARRVLG